MRKNYSGNFKAKVAVDVIREQDTLAELSSKYQIHRSLLTRWKREALEGLPGIFSATKKKKDDDKKLMGELYKKIGQLEVENDWLKQRGHRINRKRVQRLMKLMRIEAIYPKPKLTKRDEEHKIYPYLLKGVKIERPDHVWSTDITYIRIGNGFAYLTAVIDWYSRYVLSWRLSNSLENTFCIEALEEALNISQPEIFNTDQGSQYTSINFLKPLIDRSVKISMDSKGRALDNIFVERLWRTGKYEEVYLKDYWTMKEAYSSLKVYLRFYNKERLHQALQYKVPESMYPVS